MKYSPSANGFYDPAIHGSDIPADAVKITESEHAALMQGQAEGQRIVADITGRPLLLAPPPPTADDMVAANTLAIQAELDRQAALKGYDNIVSACSYAAQAAGAPFQAEGAAFLRWRSAVWAQAYAMLAEVKAGRQAMPTPKQAVAAMPALELPA